MRSNFYIAFKFWKMLNDGRSSINFRRKEDEWELSVLDGVSSKESGEAKR